MIYSQWPVSALNVPGLESLGQQKGAPIPDAAGLTAAMPVTLEEARIHGAPRASMPC